MQIVKENRPEKLARLYGTFLGCAVGLVAGFNFRAPHLWVELFGPWGELFGLALVALLFLVFTVCAFVMHHRYVLAKSQDANKAP